MRFPVLSLIGHGPHPLTGDLPSAADRFEEVIEGGPQLIGSPQQIIDKTLGRHEVYRRDLRSITADGFGLGRPEQSETLQRFAEEIAPVVRREAPSSLRN